MGTNAVGEFEAIDDLLAGDVDYQDGVAVDAGLAYAAVSVKRQVGETAVGRCGCFMHDDGRCSFGKEGGLAVLSGIDEADGGVALIGHQQQRQSGRRFAGLRACGKDAGECERENERKFAIGAAASGGSSGFRDYKFGFCGLPPLRQKKVARMGHGALLTRMGREALLTRMGREAFLVSTGSV